MKTISVPKVLYDLEYDLRKSLDLSEVNELKQLFRELVKWFYFDYNTAKLNSQLLQNKCYITFIQIPTNNNKLLYNLILRYDRQCFQDNNSEYTFTTSGSLKGGAGGGGQIGQYKHTKKYSVNLSSTNFIEYLFNQQAIYTLPQIGDPGYPVMLDFEI